MRRGLIIVGLWLVSTGAWAVEVDIIERFNFIRSLYRVDVAIPEEFFENPYTNDGTALALSEPYSWPKRLVRHRRYSVSQHPFVTIGVSSFQNHFKAAGVNHFDKKKLAERGVFILSVQPKPAGAPGLILTVRQWQHRRWFRKWMAIIGNARQTAVISCTFPEERRSHYDDKMRRVVETVTFGPPEL